MPDEFQPLYLGLLGAFLAIVFESTLSRPLYGPEACGKYYVAKLFMMAYLMLIMPLMIPFLIFAIWSLSYFFVFVSLTEGTEVTNASAALIISLIVFSICSWAWHFLFYCFPIVMIATCRYLINSYDISDFPKFVDYLSYLLAAVGIAYAVIDLTGESITSNKQRGDYLIYSMMLISLRFTKVTLERKKSKYLVSDIYMRCSNGIILLKRNV